MYIRDIRKEFFNALNGRILIMCALDVDAICACKILQFLLESHSMQYSVAPVASISDLCQSFEEYRNSVDSVILINFANSINIPKLLKPGSNHKFYIIDSHRPIDVHNFYRNPEVSVYLNAKRETELNIPSRHSIFLANDNGQDDADEQSLALLTADARDLSNEQLEKRRKLRGWLQKKQQLMFDYEEYSFYNRSVAVIMYDLALDLSKNNNYLLWLAIVGLTYQLRSEKIEPALFEREAEQILRHISHNQVSNNQARGNNWIIRWQKDLQLDLYRHWSVYESMCHTPLIVCRFQLYNDKGIHNLLEFLVSCGLKTDATKKPYKSMELTFRTDLIENAQRVCLGDEQEKYNVQEMITRSFVLTCGFEKLFCANDFVMSLGALLESYDQKSTMTEKFIMAMQSLSCDNFELLERGFEEAKLQLKSMFVQVKALITTLKVVDDGSFLHVDLQDHATISRDFARGSSLVTFTRFLLNAYVSSLPTRLARRAIRLSMILFCPDYSNTDEVLIVGIPPVAQSSKKNFFAKAFEQAAADLDCEIRPDLSETNLIRTSIDNKHRMLEQIKALLD